MKKLLLALLLLISLPLWAFDLGGYTISCYKCRESYQKHRGYAYCLGCPTWRCYDEEQRERDITVYEDGKAVTKHLDRHWFVYRCKHGHKLYVRYDGSEML